MCFVNQDILGCMVEEETCLPGFEIFSLVVTLRVGLLCVQHSVNFADESQKICTVARRTPDVLFSFLSCPYTLVIL